MNDDVMPGVIPLASVGAHLEALARHRDPGMRAFGRLIATGVGAAQQAWLDAEVARGTPATEIASGLNRLAVSTIGSVLVSAGRAVDAEVHTLDRLIEVEVAIFRAHLRQLVRVRAAGPGRVQ